VIDATCGTGQDTLALAEAVGDRGKVYAFDIQKEAIGLTSELLKNNSCMNVELFNESFVYMGEHVSYGSASAVVFNLGYLPGGDHSITTEAETTIEGLQAARKAI
ncbi:MAG: methyltransferase domain-containing protein, partial [Firmicutes bacterium]|nr:methyltransferase domain-containing protein [Bacillota bacterium]